LKYRPLDTVQLTVPAHGQQMIDAGQGTVLIPKQDSPLFLHWINDKGNTITTYTMVSAVLAFDQVKIINPHAESIALDTVRLW